MKFCSSCDDCRPKLGPVFISLLLAWVLVSLDFVVCSWAIANAPLLGWTTFFVVAGLTLYVCYNMYHWLYSCGHNYEIYCEGNTIALSSLDGLAKKHTTNVISLNEVNNAEYHPSPMTSYLSLRSGRRNIHLPLWAFGSAERRKIIDYIREHGVSIFGIDAMPAHAGPSAR